MKKKIVYILLFTILIATILFFTFRESNNSNLKKIKVAEVTHSVFYAPWYVAIENGYFEEYGIDIELVLTPGADKVSAAVLSGDVQIGFCGPESSVYVYNGGEKDYIVNFAGLTKRDGQFLVSREKLDNFTLDDLKGKEVLVGRAAGMPAVNFEKGINNYGLSSDDVTLNTSIEFAGLSGAFISGVGDFVNLFELNVTKRKQKKNKDQPCYSFFLNDNPRF